jgi:disulfide bond formation protein DsbB
MDKITDMKQLIKTYGSNTTIMGLLVFLVSFGSLGGALVSQYFFNMHPCVLCIYQRWPHGIAMVLGLAILFIGTQQPKPAAFLLFLANIVYAVGASIAIFHVGVEQEWWEGTKGCGIPQAPAGDFEAFKEAILNAPLASCKDIPFQLFGISMAGYNALICAGMAVVSLIGSVLVIRRANKVL